RINLFDSDAFFVVPLITDEKNLLGMIKVEEIDFLNVTQDNIRFLSLLGKWIMQSIVNGLRYAERERQSTFEPQTGLVRETAFWFRTKKIIASAVRHKHEVVLLLLTLNIGKEVVSLEKNIFINKIGNTIREVCRFDDEIGIADIEMPYNFMLIMPFTNKEQAGVVLNKIINLLKGVSTEHLQIKKEELFSWKVLSLEDGSLFLSEIVQDRIFNPSK
ncbi:hypothetical protein KKA14_21900, partial [bacterium]|nr:hypothetical protein [bacterium]